MKVIMVGPMDTKGRYAGGIAQVMLALKVEESKFTERGVSVQWFNNFRIQRSQYSNGKLKIQNFSNAFKTITDLKSVIAKTKPDCVYYHGSVRLALLKDLLVLKNISNVKKVIHIHYADLDRILHKNLCIRKLTLKLLRTVPDYIVTLSKKTKEELIDAGISENRISVVYNFHTFAFPASLIEKKVNLSAEKVCLDLLYMGSIDARKGIIDLLNALKNVTVKYKLHVCGLPINEEIQKEAEQIIAQLPVGTVQCYGFVSGEEKKKLLLQSDALILPSYGEGFPLVLLEGIAAGCAVISTTVGAITEVFSNKNGTIIEPGDITKLAQGIDALKNKGLLSQIQTNNYEQSKSYGIDAFIQNVSNICKNVIGK